MLFDDNLQAKMLMFELWLDAKGIEMMSNISIYEGA